MNLHKHHPALNPHASKSAPRPVQHPAGPHKGDIIFVQCEWRDWGDVFSIRQVNRRSFYFYRFGMARNPGVTRRRLLVEWEQWIDELFEKGFVFYNGYPALPPARLTPMDPVGAAECERRKRIDQALEQARLMVLESPVVDPVRDADESRFTVICGDGPAATVFVPDDADKPVTCSCGDRDDHASCPAYPCPHVFAVLIGRGEMAHRLLGFLL